MSVAATRSCCAAFMPMPKTSMPTTRTVKLRRFIDEPDDDRADEREREAEQDAGLAAVGVGDLADRIGDEEPAQAEQADRQPREARRAGQRHHHQRPEAVGELHAGAGERLRQREQRGVALDQRRDAEGGT